MNLFEKNMKVIAVADEALHKRLMTARREKFAYVSTKSNGKKVIKAKRNGKNITLPIVEENKAIGKAQLASSVRNMNLAFVQGFGNGDLAVNLLFATDNNFSMIVVEPDIDIFCALLGERDFSRFFGNERVTLSIGDKPEVATLVRSEQRFGAFTIKNFAVLKNDFSIRNYPDYFAELDERIVQLREVAIQNRTTVQEMGDYWRKNAIENLPRFITKPYVAELFNRYKSVPAVIISAGPSLDKNIHTLGAMKGKAILVAVDTAVRKMVSAGIIPDIVISIDAKEENYLHLARINLPDVIYVLNPLVDHRIIDEHGGLVLFTSAYEPLIEYVEDVTGDRGTIVAGGTVSAAAFDLCRKMGADPVILVGQDLSYGHGRSHAGGTVTDSIRGDLLADDQSGWLGEEWTEGGKMEKNIFGEDVLVVPKMETLRRWFGFTIKRNKTRTYNATEGGMDIKGAENVSLCDLVFRFSKSDGLPVETDFIQPEEGDKDITNLLEALQKLVDECRRVKDISGRAIPKIRAGLGQREKQAEQYNTQELYNSLGIMAGDIIANENFVRANRILVDFLLDDMQEIEQKKENLGKRDQDALQLHSYTTFFETLYKMSADMGRALSCAMDEIKVQTGGHECGTKEP